MSIRRTGPVRSEQTRLAILTATADLFREQGYEHLAMQTIAARAGVSKQTIYRWWPSKGAVLAECILEGLLTDGRLQPPDTGDVRADLTVWLGHVFATLARLEGENLLRSLVAAAAEHPQVGQRLRDSVIGTSLLSERLRRAGGSTPNLTSDAPFDALAQALTGAVIVAALSREAVGPTDIALLLRALLGPEDGDHPTCT